MDNLVSVYCINYTKKGDTLDATFKDKTNQRGTHLTLHSRTKRTTRGNTLDATFKDKTNGETQDINNTRT